jgi:hypothetical protein
MKIFSLFVAFTLICFALSPNARAVVPAPDGGYPGGNTAEGQNALLTSFSPNNKRNIYVSVQHDAAYR